MNIRSLVIAVVTVGSLAACATAPGTTTPSSALPSTAATSTPTTAASTTTPPIQETSSAPLTHSIPPTDYAPIECTSAHVVFHTGANNKPTEASDGTVSAEVTNGIAGIKLYVAFGCFESGESLWLFSQTTGQSYLYFVDYKERRDVTDARIDASTITEAVNNEQYVPFTITHLGKRGDNAAHFTIFAYKADKKCGDKLAHVQTSDGSINNELPSGCTRAGVLDLSVSNAADGT
jgi:hypothetical protein